VEQIFYFSIFSESFQSSFSKIPTPPNSWYPLSYLAWWRTKTLAYRFVQVYPKSDNLMVISLFSCESSAKTATNFYADCLLYRGRWFVYFFILYAYIYNLNLA